MTGIEQKLDALYEILVDDFDTFKAELKELIADPERIEDTHKFAILLDKLKDPTFLEPLVLKISLSDKDDPWLRDYLYAAICLAEVSSEDYDFDLLPRLLDKLAEWIFNDRGELAWKAADLLKFCESETAEQIQLKKLEDRDDFFLIHVACVLGLLRYNEDKYWNLVVEMSTDETRDKKLREFAKEMIERRRLAEGN